MIQRNGPVYMTYGTFSSGSTNSSSFDSSSKSSFSFYEINDCKLQIERDLSNSYSFGFQVFFQQHFPLVESTEAIDLVLVLPAHFKIILADPGLIFFRKLDVVSI